jgi:hypothetical protein
VDSLELAPDPAGQLQYGSSPGGPQLFGSGEASGVGVASTSVTERTTMARVNAERIVWAVEEDAFSFTLCARGSHQW